METEFSLASLDSLLDGNTPPAQPVDTAPPATTEPPETDIPPADEPPADGGDPSLSTPPVVDDAAQQAERARANAAFAKQRKELSEYEQTIKALGTALNIDAKEPAKILAALNDLAYQKQSQVQNVAPEVLREVDQLRQERAARDIQSKFYDLRESKGLTEAELMSFANKIDDANINLLAHPDVDLEYLYFKLSNDDIVQKRIQAAVEDAVRKVTKAGAQSSTPSKQIGKSSEEPMAINTMAGLNDLLDKK